MSIALLSLLVLLVALPMAQARSLPAVEQTGSRPSIRRIKEAARPERPPPHEWRRTTKGWELVGEWPSLRPEPIREAAFHPALLAILQLLLSLAVLTVAEPDRQSVPPRAFVRPAI
ncbi:hypothetical protein [Lignipirellula cremea]|uniref:hypothetical protein n=1 Tax=Lignipirellula cremea TaxID=2528010 RepID=UPI00119CC316|nr:hypothetical protein [Lignipirellula cremea]